MIIPNINKTLKGISLPIKKIDKTPFPFQSGVAPFTEFFHKICFPVLPDTSEDKVFIKNQDFFSIWGN